MNKESIQFDTKDEKVRAAINISIKKQKFSTAMLQTYLGKGHDYVTQLADWLEGIGVIGPENGRAPREVLISSMEEFEAKATDKPIKKTSTKKMEQEEVVHKVVAEDKKNNSKGFLIAFVVVIAVVGTLAYQATKKDDNNGQPAGGSSEASTETKTETLPNYVGQDAKVVYAELINKGYTVKFKFDRNNNGGFSEEDFQSFVSETFASEYYNETPFVVTGQAAYEKTATLYIEFKSINESENSQKNREAQLEAKLSINNATAACRMYGERYYRNFKMHSILGRLAEYAVDDDTWFIKYTVDYNGYKNRAMECYVTGTSGAPVIKDFKVY